MVPLKQSRESPTNPSYSTACIYKRVLATLHSQFPPAKALDSDFGSEILLPWTYQFFGGACDTVHVYHWCLLKFKPTVLILLPLPSEGDVLSVGVTSNGSPHPHTVCALLYESWIFDDRVTN